MKKVREAYENDVAAMSVSVFCVRCGCPSMAPYSSRAGALSPAVGDPIPDPVLPVCT